MTSLVSFAMTVVMIGRTVLWTWLGPATDDDGDSASTVSASIKNPQLLGDQCAWLASLLQHERAFVLELLIVFDAVFVDDQEDEHHDGEHDDDRLDLTEVAPLASAREARS